MIGGNFIVFDEPEMELARERARAVLANKQDKGTARRTIDKTFADNPLLANLLMVGSEMAVAKYLRVPYEFELFDVRDDGKDLMAFGQRIEVKTNKWWPEYAKGELRLQMRHKDKPFDVLFGTTPVMSPIDRRLRFWFIDGWMTHDDFLDDAEEMRYTGYEKWPMLVVEHSKLRVPTEFAPAYDPSKQPKRLTL